MRVFDDVSSVDPALRGAILTVGNFDGVHLGHQRILRTARALAKVSSAAVIAMTFEPHPIVLLRPQEAPARLTPWEEKVSQLTKAGADAVVRLKTDWPLLSLSAEDFVREILVKRIHPSYIVEGPNFGFGRGRQGNTDTLRHLSPKGGYQVHVVEPYHLSLNDEQIVVSSTVVRRCLESGEVAKAAACLGRPYTLIGKVVPGAGAGKKLGYPTINLDVGEQLVPAEGVYGGIAELPDLHATAAVSIGHRPTLGGTSLVVEAFVLDESADWYGQTVRLCFLDFVRTQRKFESREALTDQIAKDIETVRRIAAARTPR
ncbi:MAG: bifunctional riboflavin kinase/FAD synthetase [Phycisphaerales bacterium]|nr:bifunctional riboflavin kinase/FAD synthetase [Phycisphaerales bacterium]